MKRGAYVSSVDKGSIAEELEIVAGDLICTIDGQEIIDYLDYKFLSTKEHIEMEVLKENGECFVYEIFNDELEDLGINFDNMLFDSPKSCHNKCIFCFIDQMPKGMRETLYFKDDDSRLSFLYGNYVTLTNMKTEDIMRLIRYRISPVNISVHTTNPELRVFMLKNKKADKILDHIRLLYENEIEMNMQIVLCKGVNDGKELDRTIEDLSKFMPYARSISVVPVGITRYREGLHPVESFDKEDYANVINQVKKWQEKFLKEHGTRFVYASDEFFVGADIDIPDDVEYEDFPQIENGVGMLASMKTEFYDALSLNITPQNTSRTIVATGEISYEFIKKLVNDAKLSYNIDNIEVLKIKNELFGGKVTVSGLLGGNDLIRALEDKNAERVLITESMLKADEDVFLDDLTVSDVEERINAKIVPVRNDGEALLRAILGYEERTN